MAELNIKFNVFRAKLWIAGVFVTFFLLGLIKQLFVFVRSLGWFVLLICSALDAYAWTQDDVDAWFVANPASVGCASGKVCSWVTSSRADGGIDIKRSSRNIYAYQKYEGYYGPVCGTPNYEACGTGYNKWSATVVQPSQTTGVATYACDYTTSANTGPRVMPGGTYYSTYQYTKVITTCDGQEFYCPISCSTLNACTDCYGFPAGTPGYVGYMASVRSAADGQCWTGRTTSTTCTPVLTLVYSFIGPPEPACPTLETCKSVCLDGQYGFTSDGETCYSLEVNGCACAPLNSEFKKASFFPANSLPRQARPIYVCEYSRVAGCDALVSHGSGSVIDRAGSIGSLNTHYRFTEYGK